MSTTRPSVQRVADRKWLDAEQQVSVSGMSIATPYRPPSPNAPEKCPVFPSEWKKLTYPLPPYFGLPSIPIVLETESGTCNLFESPGTPRPNVCDKMSRKEFYEPDPHVREVISSLFWDCHYRKCYGVDVGANIGYFSLWMAALGAEVVSFEPQIVRPYLMNSSVMVDAEENLTHNFVDVASGINEDSCVKLPQCPAS
ncbi:hypothetical protein HDU85_000856 [Gaertneriomyces sp. JEL0708]|nr:hypothetical protein HDU85_000856 [Gaertneriomyces sp. JEL0708]